MSYQLYRNTTLGNTLQESLDELIQYGQITPQLAIKVLLQFDKVINQALATRVKSRLTFKAGKLNTYRFCDNVWTFMLNDVEFREVQEVAMVDKVKIVACDGKSKYIYKCGLCNILNIFKFILYTYIYSNMFNLNNLHKNNKFSFSVCFSSLIIYLYNLLYSFIFLNMNSE
ncbi:Transcription initiation factor IIA subunit 2 [Harpegnathos saltator]|uniref:Transcription initiation factor IIA subunit 2 n=1 Tax=Harpegnathos saltator TaxID=610380 RepID=E2BFC2_HARSA|nr:Transcription initiation factor IIA subunit 2 [Harpegnathos saltator]